MIISAGISSLAVKLRDWAGGIFRESRTRYEKDNFTFPAISILTKCSFFRCFSTRISLAIALLNEQGFLKDLLLHSGYKPE